MAKKRTTLLLEPSLVKAAQKVLGAKTITETVELSLREVVKDRCTEALRRRLDLGLPELRRLRRNG